MIDGYKQRDHAVIKIRRAAKLLKDAETLLQPVSGYMDISDDAGRIAKRADNLLDEIQAQKEFLGQ